MDETRYEGDISTYVDADNETSLRAYDQALIEWLRTLTFRGEHATVKTAWESRFFSQNKDVQFFDPKVKSQQHLPLIALSFLNLTPDKSRRSSVPIRMSGIGPLTTDNMAYVGGANGPREEAYVASWPSPILLSYQIDIWTKTRQDLRFLMTSLLQKWDIDPEETFIRISFRNYGTKLIPLILSRIDDTSDLETDEQMRVLRATVSLEVRGWIFKRPYRRPTVHNTHMILIDAIEGTESYDQEDTEAQMEAAVDHYCNAENYSLSDDGTQLLSVTELDPNVPRVLTTLSWNDGELVDVGGM